MHKAPSIDEMTVRDRQDFRTAVSDLSDRVQVLRQDGHLVIHHNGQGIAKIDLNREVLELTPISGGRNRWLDDKLVNMAPMFGIDVRENHLTPEDKPQLTESAMPKNHVQTLLERYRRDPNHSTNRASMSEASIGPSQTLMGVAEDWGEALKQQVIQELEDNGYPVDEISVLGIELKDGHIIDPQIRASVSDQTISGIQTLYFTPDQREVSEFRQGIDAPIKSVAYNIVQHFERKVYNRR